MFELPLLIVSDISLLRGGQRDFCLSFSGMSNDAISSTGGHLRGTSWEWYQS